LQEKGGIESQILRRWVLDDREKEKIRFKQGRKEENVEGNETEIFSIGGKAKGEICNPRLRRCKENRKPSQIFSMSPKKERNISTKGCNSSSTTRGGGEGT